MIRLTSLFILALLLAQVQAQSLRPSAAAIASAHPLATRAGHEILAQGGNAFDAAVAVTAVLAVVEPMSSGIGGGGFWLLHRGHDGYEIMIDGREKAPLAAHRDMYLDKEKNPLASRSLDGPLAAAIPGVPAALDHITKKYGRLTLKKNLAPAIRLARKGFSISRRYRAMARFRHNLLSRSPAAARVFLDKGFVPEISYRVKQADLAQTLEALAREGRKGFYRGAVADKLVKGVRVAGGIWSKKDLQQYRVIERKPITGRYRGIHLTSASLPSSGGIVLVESLNILKGFPLGRLKGAERKHTIIEALRRAYRDRARYLGDSDFVQVDVRKLTDPAYARSLQKNIRHRTTPSKALTGMSPRKLGSDTTHFSIIDRQGNRVAATLSINYPFGSAFMPPGTGVLLNNEMDDFSIKPGVANVYGLVGNSANAIAPGKRPLSSMSPTFLETDDAVVILGTPGGSRIISMVLLAALEFAEGRGGPREWVSLPRYHHQYLPDVVQYESEALSQNEIDSLRKRGHKLEMRKRNYGNMQAIVWYKRKNKVRAASDPRGEGLALVR